MAEHNKTGKDGEDLAATWMTENGFSILHRNWTHSHYEIDIVATKGRFLHFVEVKTRNYNPYGFPENSVTKTKFRSLKRAADAYLFQYPGHAWIQYDVLAITLHKDKKEEYFFIEDVFFR